MTIHFTLILLWLAGLKLQGTRQYRLYNLFHSTSCSHAAVSLFVGVHFRHHLIIFSFGPRKVYIPGHISCMACSETYRAWLDEVRTIQVHRSRIDVSILVFPFSKCSLETDTNGRDTPIFTPDVCNDHGRRFPATSSVRRAPSTKSITVMTTTLPHIVGTPIFMICVTHVGHQNISAVDFQLTSTSVFTRNENRLIQGRASRPRLCLVC